MPYLDVKASHGDTAQDVFVQKGIQRTDLWHDLCAGGACEAMRSHAKPCEAKAGQHDAPLSVLPMAACFGVFLRISSGEPGRPVHR